MKKLRVALVLISAALAVAATAQAPTVQGLEAAQGDLVGAIKSMESALPIYDGLRVKAIRKAHRALIMIDEALYGTKAKKRKLPKSVDTVPSGTAHNRYSPGEITNSQAAMAQGLQALQAAQHDFQQAVNNAPNKKGVTLSNLIEGAYQDAQKGINLHGAP